MQKKAGKTPLGLASEKGYSTSELQIIGWK